MKYLIITITMFLMSSCQKENTQRQIPINIDTTAYFRFSDNPVGTYCFSRVYPSPIYPGKIDVYIKDVADSSNWIALYNMAQTPSGETYFIDYTDYAKRGDSSYAEARIDNKNYYSVWGGSIMKYNQFKFDFFIKYDHRPNSIIYGEGEY